MGRGSLIRKRTTGRFMGFNTMSGKDDVTAVAKTGN